MACKASVIIPVYNAEKTLRRCVESIVLGQERDVEVIIVDDCSKDYSWDLCQELAREFPNVTAVQNKQNFGVSFTRNHGLDLAQGSYVLFVDSDDWVSQNYVKTMTELAVQYPDSLPICGQHFIDKVHNTSRDYTWNGQDGSLVEMSSELFFDLLDRFLLQQLWNKIFHRDIIEQNHIRFDEHQTMGEDFQFVLDYMDAIHCQKCVVINKPLYYYIRWNESSLMSQFGLTENDNEYRRLRQLLHICGADCDEMRSKYERAVEALKKNYVYQIMHAKAMDFDEKRELIGKIIGKEAVSRLYWEGRNLIVKEQIANLIGKCKEIPCRMANKLQRLKNGLIIKKARANLQVKDLTIISQNCIGGVLYHDMGMQFASPTINLFFSGSDFIRFVQNLDYYLRLDLTMSWEETYPIGRLEDITIHFMHYNTCAEAQEAWERRKQRVDYSKVLVLSTDMEDFSWYVFEEWEKIHYPKVLFSANSQYANEASVLYFRKFRQNGRVPDLIPKRLFYKNGKVISLMNSMR